LTETPRKAAINATYQPEQDARKLEEWLEMKPQLFSSHALILIRTTPSFGLLPS
jgi:hypothetical protein